MKRKPVFMWTCSTAWGWEAGETDVTFWPSLKALKANETCVGVKTRDSKGRVVHECKPVRVRMEAVK